MEDSSKPSLGLIAFLSGGVTLLMLFAVFLSSSNFELRHFGLGAAVITATTTLGGSTLTISADSGTLAMGSSTNITWSATNIIDSPSSVSCFGKDEGSACGVALQSNLPDANHVETFTLGTDTFLSLIDANISYFYKWTPSSSCFGNGTTCATALSQISTTTAWAGARWSFTNIGGVIFGANITTNGSSFTGTVLYKWMPSSSCMGNGTACGIPFQHFNQPPPGGNNYGPYNSVLFTIGANSYLLNTYNAYGTNYMYKWLPAQNCFGNGTICGDYLNEFQGFPAYNTADADVFTIGSDTFLAYVNNYNYPGSTFYVHSYVYKWMSGSSCFGNGTSCGAKINNLLTVSGNAVKGFEVGGVGFLAVSNNQWNDYLYKWMPAQNCFGDGGTCAENVCVGCASYQGFYNHARDWNFITSGLGSFLFFGAGGSGTQIYSWMASGTNCPASGGFGDGTACETTSVTKARQIIPATWVDYMTPFLQGTTPYLAVGDPNAANSNVYRLFAPTCLGNGVTCGAELQLGLGRSFTADSFTSGGYTYLMHSDAGGGNEASGIYIGRLMRWMPASICFGNGTTCGNTVQQINNNLSNTKWRFGTIGSTVYGMRMVSGDAQNLGLYKWMNAPANNGVLTNGPISVAGKMSQGMSFDGVDDEVQVPSTFGLGRTWVTIAGWVNLSSASLKGSFIKIGANDGFAIGVGNTTFENTGNHLILLYEVTRWINTNVNIGTGWHHVAMRVDALGVPEAFIDGVSIGTFSGGLALPPTGGTTYIGGYGARRGAYTLDDMRVYNRSLATSEIQTLYNQGQVSMGLLSHWTFDTPDISGTTAFDRNPALPCLGSGTTCGAALQTLAITTSPTGPTTDAQIFTAGSDSWLVVARQTTAGLTPIYKWMPSSNCFGNGTTCGTANQWLPSDLNLDLDVFTVGSDTFLALGDGNNPGGIYKWMPSSNCFGNGTTCGTKLQGIKTIAGVGIKGFTVDGVSFLGITGLPFTYLYKWLPAQNCFGTGSSCANSTPGANVFQQLAAGWSAGIITSGGKTLLAVPGGGFSSSVSLYLWMPASTCFGNGTTCGSVFQTITGDTAYELTSFSTDGTTYAGLAEWAGGANSSLYKMSSAAATSGCTTYVTDSLGTRVFGAGATGLRITDPLYQNTTYTLTCQTASGSANASILINVSTTTAAADVSVTSGGNAAEPSTSGSFIISRTGSTAADLAVNYTLTGTATNGTDYTTLSGTATILAGQTSVTVSVTPIDDFSYEGNETVIVTLSANAAYTVVTPSSVTLTLTDNETLTTTPTLTARGMLTITPDRLSPQTREGPCQISLECDVALFENTCSITQSFLGADFAATRMEVGTTAWVGGTCNLCLQYSQTIFTLRCLLLMVQRNQVCRRQSTSPLDIIGRFKNALQNKRSKSPHRRSRVPVHLSGGEDFCVASSVVVDCFIPPRRDFN